MIILDLQQVMMAALLVDFSNEKINEDLLRHMILNSVRANNHKFKREFGELIIATDGRDYWRRKIFPYYKASRRKARADSPIDWKLIHEIFATVRDELRDYFPYRVLNFDDCEADDIIATIISYERSYHSQPILILSGDHDFVQLHAYHNVKQFDPTRKKWVSDTDPDYLLKHIIYGDAGDGVPNIMSNDDTFVLGERQKRINKSKLENWLLLKDPKSFCENDRMLRNFSRNETLIDLSKIPKDIQAKIYDEYKAQEGKRRDKMFNYFIDKKLKLLIEAIQEF